VRTPRYYPDAVTLLPEITIEQVLSGIDTSEGCSVKDSFAGLDLAAAGFRPLFRAHWLAREPAGSRVRSARRWSLLTTAEQLDEWEAAWDGSAEGAGFFKPSLLEDETIGVLAGYEGDRVVAGAIANRSSTVITQQRLRCGRRSRIRMGSRRRYRRILVGTDDDRRLRLGRLLRGCS